MILDFGFWILDWEEPNLAEWKIRAPGNPKYKI